MVFLFGGHDVFLMFLIVSGLPKRLKESFQAIPQRF